MWNASVDLFLSQFRGLARWIHWLCLWILNMNMINDLGWKNSHCMSGCPLHSTQYWVELRWKKIVRFFQLLEWSWNIALLNAKERNAESSLHQSLHVQYDRSSVSKCFWCIHKSSDFRKKTTPYDYELVSMEFDMVDPLASMSIPNKSHWSKVWRSWFILSTYGMWRTSGITKSWSLTRLKEKMALPMISSTERENYLWRWR